MPSRTIELGGNSSLQIDEEGVIDAAGVADAREFLLDWRHGGLLTAHSALILPGLGGKLWDVRSGVRAVLAYEQRMPRAKPVARNVPVEFLGWRPTNRIDAVPHGVENRQYADVFGRIWASTRLECSDVLPTQKQMRFDLQGADSEFDPKPLLVDASGTGLILEPNGTVIHDGRRRDALHHSELEILNRMKLGNWQYFPDES